MARSHRETLIVVVALAAAVALAIWAGAVIYRFNRGWDAITEHVARISRLESVRMAMLLAAPPIDEQIDPLAAAAEATQALIRDWPTLRSDPPPPAVLAFAALTPDQTDEHRAQCTTEALRAIHAVIVEERASSGAIAARQRRLWRHVEAMAALIGVLAIGSVVALLALRRAGRASAAERLRLESVASNLPGIFLRAVLSPTRPARIEYISQGVERVYGVSPRECMDDPQVAMARVVPEDLPIVLDARQKILETGHAEDIEFRVLDREGRVRWMRRVARVSRMPGGEIALDSVLIDMTAVKEAEAALAASEQRYRTLVESSPDGIVVHRDFRIVYANSAAARLLGAASSDALLGVEILHTVHPEHREFVRERVRAVYEHGAFTAKAQERLIRLDGSTFYAEAQTAPCTFDGAPAGQTLVRDITERRRQDERLNFLNRELQHRVKNNLAAVQSIADQTARHARTVEEHREAFRDRIQAMARMNDLMRRIGDGDICLHELLERTLETYLGDDRGVTLAGPRHLRVNSTTAETLNRVINELAANAAKHGALSSASGRVDLRWSRAPDGAVSLVWTESGGPVSPCPPTRRGFGAELIEGSIPHELGGAVRWTPRPEGLRCEIDLPPAAFVRAAASDAPPA